MVGNLELRRIRGEEIITPLNQQQLRFVEEYIKDTGPSLGRPTRSAKRAGYSLESASSIASSMMKDSRIKKMIQLSSEEGAERLGLTAERVLQELSLIAFAKVDGLVTKDENNEDTVDLQSLSRSNSPTEVIVNKTKGKGNVTSVTVKSVKLSDKISALEKLGKHFDLFTDKVEVTANVSLVDLIEQSMKIPQTVGLTSNPEDSAFPLSVILEQQV